MRYQIWIAGGECIDRVDDLSEARMVAAMHCPAYVFDLAAGMIVYRSWK